MVIHQQVHCLPVQEEWVRGLVHVVAPHVMHDEVHQVLRLPGHEVHQVGAVTDTVCQARLAGREGLEGGMTMFKRNCMI